MNFTASKSESVLDPLRVGGEPEHFAPLLALTLIVAPIWRFG